MVGGAADERRELRVLMRELHELDAAPAALHLVSERSHLRRSHGVLAPLSERERLARNQRSGGFGASRSEPGGAAGHRVLQGGAVLVAVNALRYAPTALRAAFGR
jgi:hypothetical protein